MLKKILLSAAGLALAMSFAAPSAMAAPPAGAGALSSFTGAKAPVDPLNLTAAQKTKLSAIGAATQAKVKGIQRNTGLSTDAKATQIAAVVTDMQAQQRAALNPDQQKKFDALQAQAKAADPMHLTTLQQVQLQLITTDGKTRSSAIAANKSLSIDDRAKQVEAVLNDTKQKRLKVLNPAQQKLLNAQDEAQMNQDPLHRTIRQRIKLKIIQEEAMSNASGIMSDPKLNQQQKQAKFMTLQAKMEKDGQAVLTPAQIALEKKLQASAAASAAPRK
jgi:hypothetical protein